MLYDIVVGFTPPPFVIELLKISGRKLRLITQGREQNLLGPILKAHGHHADGEGPLRIERRCQLFEVRRERPAGLGQSNGDDDIGATRSDHVVDFWYKGPRTADHHIAALQGQEHHEIERGIAHIQSEAVALMALLALRLPIQGG